MDEIMIHGASKGGNFAAWGRAAFNSEGARTPKSLTPWR